MQFRFFAIPVFNGSAATEDLNRFLAGHSIWSVERQLVNENGAAFWAICVAFHEAVRTPPSSRNSGRTPTIDYREVLPPDDFRVFSRLRELRKRLATQDGVPAYALFTNQQLATMVVSKMTTMAEIEGIDGVGAARAQKYAAAFLDVLQASAATKEIVPPV